MADADLPPDAQALDHSDVEHTGSHHQPLVHVLNSPIPPPVPTSIAIPEPLAYLPSHQHDDAHELEPHLQMAHGAVPIAHAIAPMELEELNASDPAVEENENVELSSVMQLTDTAAPDIEDPDSKEDDDQDDDDEDEGDEDETSKVELLFSGLS